MVEELLPVRATVALRGLAAGQTTRVVPSDPYVAQLLEAEFLVPLARTPTLAEVPVQESPNADILSPPGSDGLGE